MLNEYDPFNQKIKMLAVEMLAVINNAINLNMEAWYKMKRGLDFIVLEHRNKKL